MTLDPKVLAGVTEPVAATITISQADYDELVSDQRFLQCLRNAGVDNWDGYDFAQEEFNAGED